MNILYTNLADTTADGTTLTSDLPPDVGFPLANLLNGLRTKTFQVTAPTNAPHYILFDLGSAQTVNAIALINCNFLSGVSLKIQGNATNSWASPSVSVNIDGAGLSPDGLSLYNYFAGGSYRYWRLSFTPPASPIYLGRVFFGNPLTPAANFKQGFVDLQTAVTSQAVSIGGQVYIDQRNKYRTLKLNFTGILDADKYAEMLAFVNAVGVNKSFVATLDPANNATTGQTSLYCRLASFPQFTQMFNVTSGQYHGASLDLVECV